MQAITGTDVQAAADWLTMGFPVAIPTETVYGLAANAFSETAVVKIFEVKDRPFFDPLIVHISRHDDPEKYASDIPAAARLLMQHFWPGPLTLILPKKDIIPDIVTAGQPTVGLRMPRHPMAQSLLESLPFPLAAPSANPFGYVSPTTAQHVQDQLGNKIPYILDGGACTVGLESTIIGFTGDIPVLYRMGGISIEDIEKVTGKIELQINQSSNPSAPGQLQSHYAPGKRVYLGDVDSILQQNSGKKAAVISFKKSFEKEQVTRNLVLSPGGSLAEAAAHLFRALREADSSGAEIIVAEIFPEEGLGRAINDRLKRAAHE